MLMLSQIPEIEILKFKNNPKILRSEHFLNLTRNVNWSTLTSRRFSILQK